jgi:hypothetical protein
VSADRIAERAAEIIALARNMPRVAALSDEAREAWARGQAERDVASTPWLPGKLAWATIEATYRDLAGRPPGLGPDGRPFRRKRSGQPSRPEVAAALLTSPATLKRACAAQGRGEHWPPRGF